MFIPVFLVIVIVCFYSLWTRTRIQVTWVCLKKITCCHSLFSQCDLMLTSRWSLSPLAWEKNEKEGEKEMIKARRKTAKERERGREMGKEGGEWASALHTLKGQMVTAGNWGANHSAGHRARDQQREGRWREGGEPTHAAQQKRRRRKRASERKLHGGPGRGRRRLSTSSSTYFNKQAESEKRRTLWEEEGRKVSLLTT